MKTVLMKVLVVALFIFWGGVSMADGSRVLIVSKSGSGDYLTVSDACKAAKDGDTVYICDGIYEESVIVGNKKIHLIGESTEGTILKYTGTQYAHPPLEMCCGSIENLTIWATTEKGKSKGSGGYCLHCDDDYSAGKYLICRNVRFQNDHYQSIGIGLRPHFTLSFENCEFIGQVYCHDSDKTYPDMTGQELRFVNCSFSANQQPLGAIRMQSQEKRGAYATVLFQRCIVNNGNKPPVFMGLWKDNGLSKDGWMGSSDWHLSEMSGLNNFGVDK